MFQPVRPTADVGIIIGRFQVPELHTAHTELIESVLERHPKVIVILGLSPLLVTTNNPLDFESRKQMILEKFPEVSVLYIKDCNNDTIWSRRLDEQIQDLIGEQTAILYGSRDSFIRYYHGKYTTQELEAKEFITGTDIRKSIKAKVRPSYDFRAGVIWAAFNRFTICYSTVDVIIYNENRTKILLIRKPSMTKWQFVGGFASVDNNSYEDDARREVMEEVGIEISTPLYVGSTRVEDYRYKNERDKIKTLVFEAKYIFGTVKAGDDAFEAKWFDIADIEDNIADFHKILMKYIK